MVRTRRTLLLAAFLFMFSKEKELSAALQLISFVVALWRAKKNRCLLVGAVRSEKEKSAGKETKTSAIVRMAAASAPMSHGTSTT